VGRSNGSGLPLTCWRPKTKKRRNICGGAFSDLGWLMGLEPTTTGITILKNKYFAVLMTVGTINTNQQLISF
jgi:hypothetical protein